MTTRKELYDDAVSKLKDYIPGTSKEDFLTMVLLGTVGAAANTNDPAKKDESFTALSAAMSPIVDLINGGSFAHEILNNIESQLSDDTASAEKIGSLVRFTLSEKALTTAVIQTELQSNIALGGIVSCAKSFSTPLDRAALAGTVIFSSLETFMIDGVIKTEANQIPADPTKESPNIAVIELLNPQIGTSVRDTVGLSIFCSMIPTHVISRAVPFVSVKVYTPDAISFSNGKVTSKQFSTLRYLKGEHVVDGNTPESAMVFSMMNATTASARPGGMELFTSPQTMISDTTQPGFKNFGPVDKFRPLMTLSDLSFEVVSAGAGMMSYKQATMSVVLHDRGRLSEIASFVKPALYGKTEVEIEYGWSIDAKSSTATAANLSIKDDAFAQLVDSLRVKEKYSVVNSTFQFDDAGQVNINLTLAMKGANQVRSYDLAGDIAKQTKTELIKLVGDIQKLVASSDGRAESVFGETLMSGVGSVDAVLNMDEEELKKVREAVTKMQNSKAAKSADYVGIFDGLGKIFKTGGKAASISSEADTAIGATIGELASSIEIFPCCEETYKSGVSSNKSNLSILLTGQKGAYTDGSISLGKVLLAFVGKPLAKSGQFDEIQFIFNKINPRAGFVRNLSMAAFPLDKKKLLDSLKKLYKKNVSVSLSMLMSTLGDEYVNAVNCSAYGFSSAYNDKGELQEKTNSKETQIYVDEQCVAAGITDKNFQQPRLSISPECVPHKDHPTKTILRIHVTDAVNTPYQTYSDALTAARSDSTFLVDSTALTTDQKLFPSIYWRDLDPTTAGKIRTDEIAKMAAAGVLVVAGTGAVAGSTPTSIDLTKLFKSGDPKVTKKFFSESLPVIRYGSSAGMIKGISVSSISDPQMATINMLKQNETSGDSEAASREAGLPLMVAPTEVSVDMLGCPILNFGQSAYIDFGTNTTIDNIYVVTNLSHKLAPGEFTTTAKFTLNVGAYGIYNSSKRSVDIASALLQQAIGEQANVAAEQAGTPTAGYQKLKWGTDIMAGVTYDQIKTARSKRGVGTATKILVWSGANPNQAPATLEHKFDDKTQIVYGVFTAPATGGQYSYIAIDYPSAGTQGTILATKYSNALPNGEVLEIDMTAYHDEYKKAKAEDNKAQAEKAAANKRKQMQPTKQA